MDLTIHISTDSPFPLGVVEYLTHLQNNPFVMKSKQMQGTSCRSVNSILLFKFLGTSMMPFVDLKSGVRTLVLLMFVY